MEIVNEEDHLSRYRYNLDDYRDIQNGIKTNQNFINGSIKQLLTDARHLYFSNKKEGIRNFLLSLEENKDELKKEKECLAILIECIDLIKKQHDYTFLSDIYIRLDILAINSNDRNEKCFEDSLLHDRSIRLKTTIWCFETLEGYSKRLRQKKTS